MKAQAQFGTGARKLRRSHLLIGLLFGSTMIVAATSPADEVPLRALSQEDVGADALRDANCYAHDGPSVLVVAAERNAIVNAGGDLRLLRRANDGPARNGAKYVGTDFEVMVMPSGTAEPVPGAAGRANMPAEVRVKEKGRTTAARMAWNCRT